MGGHDWDAACAPGPTSALTGITAGLFFFFNCGKIYKP